MQHNDPTAPRKGAGDASADIGALTSNALEYMISARQAVRRLAEARACLKLSPGAAAGVARELDQLLKVLSRDGFKHSVDTE